MHLVQTPEAPYIKPMTKVPPNNPPANQLPSIMLPSLSLCRHHPPTSTKDGPTRWPPVATVLVTELSQVQYAVQPSVQRGVQITLTFFPEMRQVKIEPALNVWLNSRAEHVHVEFFYGRICTSRPTTGAVNFLHAPSSANICPEYDQI